jgi:hypothetical protein
VPFRNAKAQVIADGADAYVGAGAGVVPLYDEMSFGMSAYSIVIRCASLQRSTQPTPIVTRS